MPPLFWKILMPINIMFIYILIKILTFHAHGIRFYHYLPSLWCSPTSPSYFLEHLEPSPLSPSLLSVSLT